MGENFDVTDGQAAPELIRHFELFRDAGSTIAEVFTEREERALARFTERFGVLVALPRSVRISASVKAIAVPVKRGVLLLISTVRPDGRPDLFAGVGDLECVLNGRPIITSGAVIYGLAPDGVTAQQLAGPDGCVISAPVLSNVYAVLDPSWGPPVFADA